MIKYGHAFSSDVPEHFIRDMGYSDQEFYRLLPVAVGEYQLAEVGKNRFIVSNQSATHSLELNLKPLPDRVLGSIRIKRVEIEFIFAGLTHNERLSFMKKFDRSYQRGGG